MKRILCALIGVVVMFSCIACKKPPEIPPVIETIKPDGINREVRIGTICKDGDSDYSVVYGSEASPAEFYAATELVNFISEATGASLSLVTDAVVTEGNSYISIGKTMQLSDASLEVDYDALNGDGFFVKNVGQNLLIDGASERGVLYGVYDFLEKAIGIRFISSEVTHVPSMEVLPLYETDILEIPAFEYRNMYSYSMRTDDALYARLRLNAPERTVGDMYGGRTDWYTEPKHIADKYKGLKAMYPTYPDFNVIHNSYYYVSPSDYYATHPEFFARDENGNTIRDQAGTICQLNLLNGMTERGELDHTMEVSVAKVALESLKAFVLDDPEASVFFFGFNDWNVWDKTAETIKAEALYGGQSGILIRFVNMLSREINLWLAETQQDRTITVATWAYLFTKEAPVEADGKGGFRAVHESVVPDENVSIRIAPIELDWYYSVNDPDQIEEYANLVKEWTYLTDNMMIWTYETNFGNYLFYYPSMRQWADNLRYFRDIGVRYMMMQDNYHGFGSWQADLHTYVASKMIWNPDLKTQPLIDEFLLYYFGAEGASSVREMMQLFDDHFAYLQAEEEDFWVPFRDDDGMTLYNANYFPIALLEQAENLMKNAVGTNLSDKTITERERNARDRRLVSALVTPQMMILKNYAAYYKSGRMTYASEVFKNAEYAGVGSVSEVQTLINMKAEYGVS